MAEAVRKVAGAEEACHDSRSHEKPANNGKIERGTLKMDSSVYILDDSVVDMTKAGSSIMTANSFSQTLTCTISPASVRSCIPPSISAVAPIPPARLLLIEL